MKASQKGSGRSPKNPPEAASGSPVFTEEERAAMKDRVREVKAERRKAPAAEGAASVLEKIGQMPEPDRSIGRQLHDIVTSTAPALTPRLWYGMPAYSKDGEVLCFYQPASKFKTRYGTLGFSDESNLDEGEMWATHFAVKGLSAAERDRIASLVKRAVG